LKKQVVRNLAAAAVTGVIVGVLAWLSFGNDFWRGFLAGLVVEEFMQLAPGMTDFLIVRSARWVADNSDEAGVRESELRESVERYPGRIVKLIAAALIVTPSLSEGLVKRGKVRARFKRGRVNAVVARILRNVTVVLARVLIIVAVAAFIGGLAIAFWQSGEDAIQRRLETIDSNNLTVALDVGGVLIAVVGVGSMLMLIYGVLRYMMSGGDPGNVAAAKNKITYAILGLVIGLSTFAIIQGITSMLA
jgi:hypothetical protein